MNYPEYLGKVLYQTIAGAIGGFIFWFLLTRFTLQYAPKFFVIGGAGIGFIFAIIEWVIEEVSD